MLVLHTAAVAAATYAYASVNLAIVLTRLLKGIDIRSVGTGNAGTANVSRTLGKGWAFLVFLFDLSKSLAPLLIARRVVFGGGSPSATAALLVVAAAAILGHCRPAYYRFRGGGGVVTSMGAFLVLVPVEFVISLLAAFAIVQVFMRKAEYRFGQWIPIVFLLITPALSFAASALFDVELVMGLRFGGKPWYVSAGVLGLGLLILALNPRVAKRKAQEARGGAERRAVAGSDAEEPPHDRKGHP